MRMLQRKKEQERERQRRVQRPEVAAVEGGEGVGEALGQGPPRRREAREGRQEEGRLFLA